MTSLIRRLSQRGRLHAAGTATCFDEDARQPQVIAQTESFDMLITAGCTVPDVAWSNTRYCSASTHLQWVCTGWGSRYCLPSSSYCWVKETTCVSNGERGLWQKKLTLFGKAEETQIKQMLLTPPTESYSSLLETITPRHTWGTFKFMKYLKF